MILEDARNQKNVKVSTAHACSHDWHASSNAPQCSHAKSRHRPRPHPHACSIGGQTTRRRGDNLVEKVLALQGTRRQGDGVWIPSRLFCPGGMWIPSRFFCPGGMYLTSCYAMPSSTHIGSNVMRYVNRRATYLGMAE